METIILYNQKVELNEDDIRDYIAYYYYPEDIFSIDQLKAWAEENNYMLKED